MESWSLERFVNLNGLVEAGNVWGVSHQAVSAALKSGRTIKIVQVDGIYEVWETKKLTTYRGEK